MACLAGGFEPLHFLFRQVVLQLESVLHARTAAQRRAHPFGLFRALIDWHDHAACRVEAVRLEPRHDMNVVVLHVLVAGRLVVLPG